MGVIDFVVIGFFGAVYFRAMLTSSRDFDVWKKTIGFGSPVGPADREYPNHLRRVGPLSLSDIRVWLLTTLLVLPPFLSLLHVDGWMLGSTLSIAVGAFMAPLMLPTLYEPELADHAHNFVLKWLMGKADIYMKTAAVLTALWLLEKVPFIGEFLSSIGRILFPVSDHSRIEAELVNGAPIVVAAMVILRMTMGAAYGYIYVTSIGVSAVWIWFEYRWLFEHVLPTSADAAVFSFFGSMLLAWLSEFVLSVILAAIEHTGRGGMEKLA